MAGVLLEFSIALFAAALAALFAVFTYFRQREHELILSRYLEGGIDLLAAEVERVAETFSHNWARCLAILKSYRDLEDQFDIDELSKGFLELQSSKHNIVAHYRLYTLTGAREYWDFYQKALAYYTTANSVLVKEIPEIIRVKLTSGRITRTHADIVNQCFEVAKKQDDGGYKYVQLVEELQILSAALESERYRFKNLNKFRNKTEVCESLQRMKSLLASLGDETNPQQPGSSG